MKKGRPQKYTFEFCFNEIKQFLDMIQNDRDAKTMKYLTWQDLVRDRPYSRQRISEWREAFKDNEDFSDTIKKIEAELENRLFRIGLSGKGNSAVAIFALKNNYGWKDKQEVEHSGKVASDEPDLSKLSDEEIKQLAALNRKLRQ